MLAPVSAVLLVAMCRSFPSAVAALEDSLPAEVVSSEPLPPPHAAKTAAETAHKRCRRTARLQVGLNLAAVDAFEGCAWGAGVEPIWAALMTVVVTASKRCVFIVCSLCMPRSALASCLPHTARHLRFRSVPKAFRSLHRGGHKAASVSLSGSGYPGLS